MSKVLITSALLYANGPLHFGHIAGAYLPADCYARFKRLMGDDVLYICGSDEYGFAISMAAEIAKRTPKEHVDLFHEVNKGLFEKLNISFDHYSRTTSEVHTETVTNFFYQLRDNGFIEEKISDQLYSKEDDRFLADRYVVGTCPKCGFGEARGDECPKCGASFEATDLIKPRSKVTGAPLTTRQTNHWFMRFDKFKKELLEWLKKKNWKSNVVSFVKHYIEDLHPRAITRDSDWGIPFPIADDKVFYVWFDAPIGYISATKEWSSTKWKDYWCDPETKYVQFIGKDNIPFHAIFFPAMIMGQNDPFIQVTDLPANEFYNFEGKKFNKSTGWTIDLDKFFNRYTADQIRYTIAANAPESSDSEFTWDDFSQKVNGDLVGKYGNFANRVLTFIENKLGNEALTAQNFDEVDAQFIADIERLSKEIHDAYDSYKLRQASSLVMQLATLGNVYFDKKKPWVLIKETETKEALITTMACCLHCLKVLAMLSSPIIPDAAHKLWRLLGIETPLEMVNFHTEVETLNGEKMKLQKPEILFEKVADEWIAEEKEKLKKVSKPIEAAEPLKKEITFDQVEAIDLRVAQVIDAQAVPKSKKLLKLTVDLGFEKRTIVSGIAHSYSEPDALVGKKVIIVANLKPAKLMGIESQGMILAAGSKELELPSLQDMPVGSVVR